MCLLLCQQSVLGRYPASSWAFSRRKDIATYKRGARNINVGDELQALEAELEIIENTCVEVLPTPFTGL